MLTSFLSFLFEVKQLLPLEVALTFGTAIFALSWIYPRRIISIPEAGFRSKVLAWVGIAGALAIVVVATVTSALNVVFSDTSGFDGWWRRPAPLLTATLVIVAAALVLHREPLPLPGERMISPQRAWYTFAPRVLLWFAGFVTALIAVTATWQIAIAITAPQSGPFFKQVSDYSSLPVYMSFNNGFGYVSGVGWPNHLATLVVLALSILALVATLHVDANRPMSARSSASSVRLQRESTARLLGLLMLAGLTATLGAVWMHTGFLGTSLVGIDKYLVSENVSNTQHFIEGSYSAIAQPMNIAGYIIQGLGVSLALRIVVDTFRCVVASRKRVGSTAEMSEAAR